MIDFFVHALMQRKGEGIAIFNNMLKFLNVEPYQIAYDTPTTKFLSFMNKHFSLKNLINQANNIVVYDKFFIDKKVIYNLHNL